MWNDDGSGSNVDKGFLETSSDGAVEFTVPLDSVFALTNTPIMSLPW